MRIAVLGYIVRGPLGGLAWHHLQYVAGLSALGHDVVFVEDSDDYESCYDPSINAMTTDPTYGLGFTAEAFARLGLEQRWCYFDAFTSRWLGPLGDDALAAISSADLLINVSGVNPVRAWWDSVPHRALIDTDPVFTQVRHLRDGRARRHAEAHTTFFTFAELIGRGASVPDDGLPWLPTRQPVVPELWPVTPLPPDGPFTTVMQWNSYPAVEHDGQVFGMKSKSFEAVLELPGERPSASFVVALSALGRARARVERHGWQLANPLEVTRDPWTYQSFVQASTAEFSVAKHGYVASRSGWFSERSTGYLASGRPVIVEDTGFSDVLPSGEGILPFTDLDSAAAAIDEVQRHAAKHSAAARRAAEEHFDFRRVLPPLVETAVS